MGFNFSTIPAEGFLRLNQIIRTKNSSGILPIGRSSFLNGVKEGRFPAPVKLGKRTTAWTVKSIRDLVEQLSSGGAAQ